MESTAPGVLQCEGGSVAACKGELVGEGKQGSGTTTPADLTQRMTDAAIIDAYEQALRWPRRSG